MWRTSKGDVWFPFADGQDSEATVFAECAGLTSYVEPQREQVLALVRRIVPEPGASPAVTNLIEHVIEIGKAIPIKTPIQRMSPPILKFTQEETKRL